MRNALYSFTLALGGLALALSLGGCQKDATPGGEAQPAGTADVTAAQNNAAASQPAPPRSAPDFGGTTTRHVEATGNGLSLEAAIDNAIRLAIEQVNGKRLAARTVQITGGNDSFQGDLGSPAYANWVASRTDGAVTGFTILSQKQVTAISSSDHGDYKASHDASWDRGKVDASASASAQAKAAGGDAHASASRKAKGEWDRQEGAASVESRRTHTEYASHWEVRIGADVAVYRQSTAAKRTRIVIATPHVNQYKYTVGEQRISAEDIATTVQQALANALTQSNRFTVLSRSADPEIQQELDRVRSGSATTADAARIGQQLATDLIVIPTIQRFEYLRHARHLRMADRSLVSYSGASDIQLQVVNAVSGQIVLSQSFHHAFPATSPTTLGVSTDGQKLATDMMAALDKKMIASILLRTYPPSIVRVTGNEVIINQGGDLIENGATYEAVELGEAIVDPQTGESLGPSETPCCTIAIDRVTPKLSYGHIVEQGVTISQPFEPGSIELREQATATASAAHKQSAQPVVKKAKAAKTTATAKRTTASKDEDQDW